MDRDQVLASCTPHRTGEALTSDACMRPELRSLIVEHDTPAVLRAQDATDKLMLRGIDFRAELRLERRPSPESDRMTAAADISAFRCIRAASVQEHAAAQMAENARESQAYKEALVEAGLFERIRALDARNTAVMLETEEQ